MTYSLDLREHVIEYVENGGAKTEAASLFGVITTLQLLPVALEGAKWIAPMLFKTSCTSKTVLAWLKKILLKELTKPSVVIMDNAAYHPKENFLKKLAIAYCFYRLIAQTLTLSCSLLLSSK